MSCGNRFQCALTKSSRHSFQPDKPSNLELHNENQKRLNELLRDRESQDKMYLQSTTPNTNTNTNTNTTTISQTVSEIPLNDTQYTPWTTPSTQYYILNQK